MSEIVQNNINPSDNIFYHNINQTQPTTTVVLPSSLFPSEHKHKEKKKINPFQEYIIEKEKNNNTIHSSHREHKKNKHHKKKKVKSYSPEESSIEEEDEEQIEDDVVEDEVSEVKEENKVEEEKNKNIIKKENSVTMNEEKTNPFKVEPRVVEIEKAKTTSGFMDPTILNIANKKKLNEKNIGMDVSPPKNSPTPSKIKSSSLTKSSSPKTNKSSSTIKNNSNSTPKKNSTTKKSKTPTSSPKTSSSTKNKSSKKQSEPEEQEEENEEEEDSKTESNSDEEEEGSSSEEDSSSRKRSSSKKHSSRRKSGDDSRSPKHKTCKKTKSGKMYTEEELKSIISNTMKDFFQMNQQSKIEPDVYNAFEDEANPTTNRMKIRTMTLGNLKLKHSDVKKIQASEEEKEKKDYLYQFYLMERQGFKISKKYTIEDSIDEMRYEYTQVKKEETINSKVDFWWEIFATTNTIFNTLNKQINPFNIPSDDWDKEIEQKKTEYRAILRRAMKNKIMSFNINPLAEFGVLFFSQFLLFFLPRILGKLTDNKEKEAEVHPLHKKGGAPEKPENRTPWKEPPTKEKEKEVKRTEEIVDDNKMEKIIQTMSKKNDDKFSQLQNQIQELLKSQQMMYSQFMNEQIKNPPTSFQQDPRPTTLNNTNTIPPQNSPKANNYVPFTSPKTPEIVENPLDVDLEAPPNYIEIDPKLGSDLTSTFGKIKEFKENMKKTTKEALPEEFLDNQYLDPKLMPKSYKKELAKQSDIELAKMNIKREDLEMSDDSDIEEEEKKTKTTTTSTNSRGKKLSFD